MMTTRTTTRMKMTTNKKLPLGAEVRPRGAEVRNAGVTTETWTPARAVCPQPKWNRETATGAKTDAKKTRIRVCLDLVLSYPRSSAQSAGNFGRPVVTTADYADERG
jgi:hypothetical protein